MRIKAGSAITNEGDAYHVTRAYRHPRYNTLTVDYDVSVIVIQGKFVASRNQIPIRLSTTEDTDTMVGEEALVTGYGRLSVCRGAYRLCVCPVAEYTVFFLF